VKTYGFCNNVNLKLNLARSACWALQIYLSGGSSLQRTRLWAASPANKEESWKIYELRPRNRFEDPHIAQQKVFVPPCALLKRQTEQGTIILVSGNSISKALAFHIDPIIRVPNIG
jgi:hypothetical protein